MSADSLSGQERSVLEHLDEEALVESLIELVWIPSVGGTDDISVARSVYAKYVGS